MREPPMGDTETKVSDLIRCHEYQYAEDNIPQNHFQMWCLE